MGVGSILFVSGVFVFSTAKKPISAKEKQQQINHVVDLAIADGVLTKNERAKITDLALEYELDAAVILREAEQKMAASTVASETELVDYAKKSGDDFEKYVVQKFKKKYFTVKEWAGDKYVEGVFAETTQNPDLLMELTAYGKQHLLSVECKWRKEFKNDFIQFAKEDQLKRYKKYEEDKGIPVFIALGVGGTASKPDELFVIPLRELKKEFVNKYQIARYRKDVDDDFYYDYVTRLFD